MRTLLLTLFLFSTAVAQEPLVLVVSQAYKVKGANDLVKIGERVYLRNTMSKVTYDTIGLIRVTTAAANIVVEVENAKCQPVKVDKVTEEYYEITGAGTYKVAVTIFDAEKNIFDKQTQPLVITGDDDPEPDPDDDEPDIDPVDPDDDIDPPSPPPIDGDGMQILIVNESAKVSTYKDGWREIMNAASGRQFLTETCGTEWRLLDKDTPGTENSKWYRALQRPRTSVPWIIISNGVTGFEGPLPNNLAELRGMVEIYLPPERRRK